MPEEKKKLIRVEGYGAASTYGTGRIQFSFMSSPETGRKQVYTWQTCRDVANDLMRAHIQEDAKGELGGGYRFGTNPPVDFDKLRILVSLTDFGSIGHDGLKQNLFSAKRIINYYENMAGWGKTKISTVHHSQREKNCWLFTGPKEWMKASFLVSMVTLIIRILSGNGPLENASPENVEKLWDDLIEVNEKKRKDDERFDGDVVNYLKPHREKFKMIMHHYDEIFGDMDSKKNIFPVRDSVGFNAGGGIDSLCKSVTGISEIDERMREICDKYIKNGKYINTQK